MAEPNDSIKSALDEVGVPYAYRVFKSRDIVKPPYITYFISQEHFYGSDEADELKRSTVTIELFTTVKDFTLESRIEEQLCGNPFDKVEEFDDVDELYRITYTTELTLKIRR